MGVQPGQFLSVTPVCLYIRNEFEGGVFTLIFRSKWTERRRERANYFMRQMG